MNRLLQMNKRVVIMLASIALTAMLSACGSNATPNGPLQPTSPAPSTGTEQQDSADRTTTPSPNVTVHPVKTTKPTPTEATTDSQLRKQYVERIYKLAKSGKMVNAGDFVVGKTLIDEVHKAWGEPNKSEGGYDFYAPGMMKGTIAFGVGRGDVVKEIRIFGTALDPIKDGVLLKVSDVKAALGKPSTTRTTGKQHILVYKTGSYELKFVYTPGKSNDPTLDHINLFSPKAAKAMGEG
ncbi:hypothetical protein PaecuDRAFT_2945 [Paenibacillus curdlanolyticus YK9]|uniref:Lipoprotein n=1 Tax=Paenibacillus curdlanolyticus YK9 TaxID=717606 RepID=E0IBA6_9BACL|nr:YjgB family protein [Paenibacillus curdlanolyticus]EFM09986.1 hypothetical protein PaecuDRAFT_2945 [Paenibacillus curdlanolyticus YK9]